MLKHPRPLASMMVLLLFCPFFAGCTDIFDDNNPPTVVMTVDPSGTIKASESVIFSAVGTSDSDGDTLTFKWDFGDGNTGQGLTTSHTYANKGEFTVKLNVGDGIHETTVTKKINVVDSDAREPNAVIKSEKQNDCEDEEPPSGDFVLIWVCEDDKEIDDRDIEVSINIILDGSKSWAGCDPDDSECYAEEYIISYKWDLDTYIDSDGDGDTENDVDATGETYEWKDVTTGGYEIRLTVEDNNGFVDYDDSMVYVNYRGVWNDFVLGRVADNPQNEDAVCADNENPCELTWEFPLNYGQDSKDRLRYYRAKLTYPQEDDDQQIGTIGDTDNKLDMYLKNSTEEPVSNTTSLGNDNRDAGDCSSEDYCVWIQIGGSTVRSKEPGIWTIDVKNEKTHNTDVKHLIIELEYR